jgi:hypothetical protein
MAIAAGWLQRAQRDVADLPPYVGHGYVAMGGIFAAQAAGDLDAALESAERATAIGRRFGDLDLAAVSIHAQGRLLIDIGRIGEGIARLDEAMTSVIAGELGPFFTGVIYCSVLEACLDLGDVGRAGEWSDAAIAWCDAISPDAPFNALCRINRAQVAGMRGAWPEAESGRRSSRWTSPTGRRQLGARSTRVASCGDGWVIGPERRRRSSGRASWGTTRSPALALLRASQEGRHRAQALRAYGRGIVISVSQRAPPDGAGGRRARLARHDRCARGDRGPGGVAPPRRTFPRSWRRPTHGPGVLCAAEGDVEGAVERLRRTRTTWQELKLPYEDGAGAQGLRRGAARRRRSGRRRRSRLGRRRRRSNGSAPRPTLPRCAHSCRDRTSCRPGSRAARLRCSAWSPPGARTATSPWSS